MTRRVLSVLRGAAAPPLPKWRVVGVTIDTEVPARLDWTDGVGLTGYPPDAIHSVDAYLLTGQEAKVTPVGPFLKADKHDELSAYILALQVLNSSDVTGTPPEVPDTGYPDGAVS